MILCSLVGVYFVVQYMCIAAKSACAVIISVYVYMYVLAVSSRYGVFYVDCSGDSIAQLQIVYRPRTVSEK